MADTCTLRPRRARTTSSDALRGRAATIARLTDNLTRRNGRPPTDSEIAWWLACSVETVQRARASGLRGNG